MCYLSFYQEVLMKSKGFPSTIATAKQVKSAAELDTLAVVHPYAAGLDIGSRVRQTREN